MSAKELNIGDYVRTKEGIEKIICIEENFMDDNVTFYATDNDMWRSAYNGRYNGFTSRSDVIIKSSPNIIDLLEEGDLVKIEYYSPRYEERVIRLFEVTHKGGIYTNLENARCSFMLMNNEFNDNDKKLKPFIKSIVTKEQFESMEYKIGE